VRLHGRTPVFLIRRPVGEEWDFTGGRARELEAQLRASGAVEIVGTRELLTALGRRTVPAGSQ
jgi:hypothetical protein